MAVPPDKVILTVQEAAEVLGISAKTCYNWIHIKGFPCLKVGNCRRIHRDQLMEWFKKQAIEGGQ